MENPLIHQAPLTDTLKKQIYEGFAEHALEETGLNGLEEPPQSFTIKEDEKIIAAVVVVLFWGQLHVKYVYVKKTHRGKGFARYLMQRALQYGRKNGCTFAYVETMNFQAPEFYEKLGFKNDFVRSGFSNNASFHYLSMPL